MEPRPHQVEALDAVDALRATDADRALVVMACGTGKSLIGCETARARHASTVLVTVPTLALAAQVSRGWAAAFPGVLDTLIVCSDPSVGGPGVPVTVSPDRIAEFLVTDRPGRVRLVISTYHSVDQIAAAYAAGPVPELDLIVLDEAHHTAGPAGKAYAVVLDQARIPARFRLALTATPRVHSGADGRADVVSMDDERLYGKRAYELTFGAGIRRKLLTDYEVAIVLVSDAEVHATLLRQDVTPATVQRDVAQTVGAQVALSRAMHEQDLRRVIAFHSRVERSQRFATTLGNVSALTYSTPITSLHMDGTTPGAARAAQLRRLARPRKGERVVLHNVRTLTEGVDVDSVDGVCLVDPKTSQSDIVQAVGRALRLHPDHDRPSLILLPVYLAPGENPQAVLEASAFRHVWRVLSTLRDQDERMDAALTAARRQLHRDALTQDSDVRAVLPDRIKVYGGEHIDSSIVSSVGIHIVEQVTEDWFASFGQLERYAAEHGHAAVPFSAERGSLGSWASAQRARHAVGDLPPQRVALLEGLPGWSWRLMDTKRERGRQELAQFIAETGHAGVPRGHVTATGYRLDSFVTLVRNRRRDGLTDAEEIAYYDALPGWMWNVIEAKFQVFLEHLDAYVAVNGHTRVPQRYVSELNGATFVLGLTVSRKRAEYRNGTLPAGQGDLLEARPRWHWDADEAIWDQAFMALAEWATQHGNIKVPFDEAIRGVQVYRWLLKQKKQIRDGTLRRDLQERLESLPGWSLT
ncbi:DEAD/DEAH box helicase [Streptomyces goshikiensis]|uniref:DEAD/DEAH box helicase n=1 Tax=Streptomyces goshikiensis TaxID=1942 RepID=UPI00367AF746